MENYEVKLSPTLTVSLPLVKVNENLSIYSFNMMGKGAWNREAAKSLFRFIKMINDEDLFKFDAVLTAESKAIALTEQLTELLGIDRYVVLRKGEKAYMENPIMVETKSITTAGTQRLYLDRLDLELVQGKKVLVVDDVISTGGTLDAILTMAEKAGFTIQAAACVLTEGEHRAQYKNIPVIALGHIPLP
jgi:adenine phosphoribosyltransferase